MADPRNESPSDETSETEDQLVAYLDGELDAGAASDLETRLATDVACRERLRQLEKAWSLLDKLPRATVDESFTRSTVEIVALAAEEDVRQAQDHTRRRGRWRVLLATLALVVAAATGFAATRWILPNRNDALLANLSVIENLDLYQQVPSVAFLESLNTEKLFADEVEADQRAAPAVASSLDESRERLLAMSAPDQERLRGKQDRFDNLDADERERLSTLDRDLREHPKREELWRVLLAYHAWLKTLSPDDRTRLQQPDAAERLAAVRSRRQAQQKRDAERLSRTDRQAIMKWLDEFIVRNGDEIINRSRSDETRKEFMRALQGDQRKDALRFTYSSRIREGYFMPPITDQDYAKLGPALSTPARAVLAKAKTTEDRNKVLQTWVREMSGRNMRGGGPWGGRMPQFSPASPEELKKFLDSLPKDDSRRDQLLGMPREEMERTLQRWYWEDKELQKLLTSLPKEEQDKLNAMTDTDRKKELQRKFWERFRPRGGPGDRRDRRPGDRRRERGEERPTA
jgi:hypothetical protein